MAETTTSPSVKKYYDYAQQQVDEQAILDKYNAATLAQFNAQREANRQSENQFYNQMYNTQKTAMDTIRQSNAAAVASGASRGVQAAQELSSLLGLQQESVASATELAQANRQTAQEETAAVLENVLKAYQQASQERSQLVQQGIESASVDVQQDANKIAAMEFEQTKRDALQSAAAQSTTAYLAELNKQGQDYSKEYSAEGQASLDLAINAMTTGANNIAINKDDWASLWDYASGPAGSGAAAKYGQLETNVKSICQAYGLNYSDFAGQIKAMNPENRTHAQTKDKAAAWWNANYNSLIANIRAKYANKAVQD